MSKDLELMLDLSGPDGNAFVLLGTISKMLKRSGRTDLSESFMEEAMGADYNHLLEVCNCYVDLIDTSNSYPDILGEVQVTTVVKRLK